MRRLRSALLTLADATVDPTAMAKAASHGPRAGGGGKGKDGKDGQDAPGATGNGEVVMQVCSERERGLWVVLRCVRCTYAMMGEVCCWVGGSWVAPGCGGCRCALGMGVGVLSGRLLGVL